MIDAKKSASFQGVNLGTNLWENNMQIIFDMI